MNDDEVRAVAEAFRARGLENRIITMGGNGSVAAGKDGVHYTPCAKMPNVADPTAAGDSFIATFCTSLTVGISQQQALDFASHMTAIMVSRMGAITSLPTLTEVQRLLQERANDGFSAEILNVLK